MAEKIRVTLLPTFLEHRYIFKNYSQHWQITLGQWMRSRRLQPGCVLIFVTHLMWSSLSVKFCNILHFLSAYDFWADEASRDTATVTRDLGFCGLTHRTEPVGFATLKHKAQVDKRNVRSIASWVNDITLHWSLQINYWYKISE